MAKKNLHKLYQYVDQIDTSLYKDFRRNIISSNDPNIYKLGCEMRDTCDETQRKQYKQLMTLFISLCQESYDRYYLNILRMITLLSFVR